MGGDDTALEVRERGLSSAGHVARIAERKFAVDERALSRALVEAAAVGLVTGELVGLDFETGAGQEAVRQAAGCSAELGPVVLEPAVLDI